MINFSWKTVQRALALVDLRISPIQEVLRNDPAAAQARSVVQRDASIGSTVRGLRLGLWPSEFKDSSVEVRNGHVSSRNLMTKLAPVEITGLA